MSCPDHGCSVCQACAKELLAVGARSERKRIARRVAPLTTEAWEQVALIGWDDGSARNKVHGILAEIVAATRAPKPKRAVRPGKGTT